MLVLRAGQGQEGGCLHPLHLWANPLGCPRKKETPDSQQLLQTEEKGEAVRLTEGSRRPDGAPESAGRRRGRRGWRLKCSQAVSEEEKTCPMGVEGSAAINHRTGFSAFLLEKGQARKSASSKRADKGEVALQSGQQAMSGLVMLCGPWLPPHHFRSFHQSQLATTHKHSTRF